MRGNTNNYTDDDIAIAQFALAIALPIRVFIIRTIIGQNNNAFKQDFDSPHFNAANVLKHISQLKALGILKSVLDKGVTTYSINQQFFRLMSEKFNSFFEDMRAIDAPQTTVSTPSPTVDDTKQAFGTWLKSQRLSFELTQQQFADQLNIERAQLSKIEAGKMIFPADKLDLVSKAIYEDAELVKKIYYSDQIAGMIQDGNLTDAIFSMAKLKAKK